MPEMNYNTQYQDLINKLIQSKPKPTIDPLTQMLLSIGGSSASQPTNSPQTNRLGQMFNEGMKVYANATDEQNKGLRLWDAQNVDFLRAVLMDETAKAKAKAEVEQRTLENNIKLSAENRAIQEATEKGELEKRNREGALSMLGIETGYGAEPITYNEKDYALGQATKSPEIVKAVIGEYIKNQYKEPTKFAPHAPSYANYTDGKRVVRVAMGSKEQLDLHNSPKWSIVSEGMGGIDKKAEKRFEIVNKLNDTDIIKKSGWAVEDNNGRLKFIERKTWYGGKIKPTEQMVTLLNNAQGHIDSLGEGGQGGSSAGMLMDEAIKFSKQMMGEGEPKQEKPQSDINMQEAYSIYMTDPTGTKLIERYGSEGAKEIREWIKINIKDGGRQPSSSLKVNIRQ